MVCRRCLHHACNIASKAPEVDEIDAHLKTGSTLLDLKQMCWQSEQQNANIEKMPS